jgi:hypothetical protein
MTARYLADMSKKTAIYLAATLGTHAHVCILQTWPPARGMRPHAEGRAGVDLFRGAGHVLRRIWDRGSILNRDGFQINS